MRNQEPLKNTPNIEPIKFFVEETWINPYSNWYLLRRRILLKILCLLEDICMSDFYPLKDIIQSSSSYNSYILAKSAFTNKQNPLIPWFSFLLLSSSPSLPPRTWGGRWWTARVSSPCTWAWWRGRSPASRRCVAASGTDADPP